MTQSTPPFDSVLVANRGEIARRVIRTLRRLGIRSIAVYSDADAGAPHVAEADTAVRIGPAPAVDSYLSIEAVIRAARDCGAQAVHPGYGFLSENAAFARACQAAGIVFIGPAERALDVMGDKIRSKEHVARHGVPVVPGFSAAGMTDAEIADAAREAGYPLLVKPSAGGGGKGMHIVRDAAGLPDALATARRIAAASFGDDTLLLERLIDAPRHIEVQVLADETGRVIHLGERECTLQRRHQKVVEEAPSPIIDAATRARLGEAACAAAASVDYRGAGTVEFLVSGDRPDDFFFIEMNTRLQVEHPVTELVTGVDLVEQQLRIAAGEPLALAQQDVTWTGHAIEARVYAESPARGFLPSTGDVLVWRPARGARTDAAVETGSVVTADYDPMIAKVIAFGGDRAEALERLDTALSATVLLGVETNIAFLRTLVRRDDVRAGDLDTGLIDRMPAHAAEPPSAAALAAVRADSAATPSAGTAASPPWTSAGGWRLGGAPVRPPVRVLDEAGKVHLVPDDAPAPTDATTAVDVDGWTWVHVDGATDRLRVLSRRDALERRLAAREAATGGAAPDVRAAMPGSVVAVHVADGARVRAGDRLVTVEAMKMEHPASAPHDGVVTIDVSVGDRVSRDHVLARVAPEAGDPASVEP